MAYIYSTLSTDMDYASYAQNASDTPSIEKVIRINGGANIASKHFLTPKGVMTSVTDDELTLLEANPVFQIHKENGFILVEKKSTDADAVAKNMKSKDKSAPVTPEDYVNSDTVVKTNKD